ncbi:phage holin family protein [Variovorax sp. V116]
MFWGLWGILRRMRIIIKWLLSAVALLAVAYLYSGVQVASFGSALIAAAVIGLLNMVVRPVLVVLTLPVTIVTLGLFLFVINALLFWAASGLLSGFQVSGFVAALIGSLIYSLLGLVIEAALGGLLSKG